MENEFVTNWEAQVKKGILSYIVLNIIKQAPCYGYELMDKIQNLSFYVVAEGTLYPLLDRLKREELLVSKWVHQPTGLPRKYYYITEQGSATLLKMNEHWHSLADAVNNLLEKDIKHGN